MATGTVILPVQSAKLTSTFIALPAGIDNSGGIWKLLFDASQTESALWQFRLPANYASSPVMKLIYSMASATSLKVDLEVEVMCVSDNDSQDIDSASFDSVNEIVGGTTVPGTAGYIDEISITLTNFDSGVANDLMIARVNRDHDDADDTATGDLELLAISLEYTTT